MTVPPLPPRRLLPSLLAALLGVAPVASAEDLRTTRGTVYRDVEITFVESTSIGIRAGDRFHQLSLTELPADWREKARRFAATRTMNTPAAVIPPLTPLQVSVGPAPGGGPQIQPGAVVVRDRALGLVERYEVDPDDAQIKRYRELFSAQRLELDIARRQKENPLNQIATKIFGYLPVPIKPINLGEDPKLNPTFMQPGYYPETRYNAGK